MKRKHAVDYICSECGESKPTLQQLKDHQLSHKKISCPKCEEVIPFVKRQRHIKLCKGKMKCDQCDFKTSSVLVMQKHKRKLIPN